MVFMFFLFQVLYNRLWKSKWRTHQQWRHCVIEFCCLRFQIPAEVLRIAHQLLQSIIVSKQSCAFYNIVISINECLTVLFDYVTIGFIYVFLFILNRLTSTMTGNQWLYYSYATFEIYAKNAVDGTPLQYGDVVGLKYPYYRSSYWMTYYGSYFRPRSCSSTSKTSCARENSYSGFRIFKKL